MTPSETLDTYAEARSSAVRRLHRAQEELRRARPALHATAHTSREPSVENRVSACSAALSAREEWLHWLDHKRSRHPEADGDWASSPRSEARVDGPGTGASAESERWRRDTFG